MNTFRLKVSSPDGNIFDGNIVKFDVRGVEGDLAVMAGHVPFVTSVVKGVCTVWLDDDTKKTATSEGGLLTVDKDLVTYISGTFKFDEEKA